ncbi:serine-rich adhesin for platelets-like [Daphnia carinata]|uniref:serine-rich adhesin for platelets-like n=1 Tax=Daphnia carinata TaxID=120202 RepID=UPI002580330D|nr:serine-rich adhesin for platelets-like [Daphnia carinata]
MKFALLLLLALVVISQQFYLRQPSSRVFWAPPYTSPHAANNYRPLIFITHEDFNPSFIPTEGRNHTDDDQNEFPDIQSRVRGFSNNRMSPLNNQKGRFLIGGFGTNGLTYNGYYNTDKRFYKTFTTLTTTTSTSLSTIFATSISTLVTVSTSTTISTSITSTTSTSTVVVSNTATLTVASLVTCVPQFQVVVGAVACAAGRRKRQINDSEQFIIAPTETLELTTTALPSLDVEQSTESDLPVEDEQKNVNALASSKDETHLNDEDNLREKRFLNRYQFSTSTSTLLTTSTTTSTSVSTSTSIITVPTTSVTVSTSILTSLTTTTMTSFVFVNQTITQTVNLINPAPAVQCAGDTTGDNVVTGPGECVPVACLPAGFVVCAAAG